MGEAIDTTRTSRGSVVLSNKFKLFRLIYFPSNYLIFVYLRETERNNIFLLTNVHCPNLEGDRIICREALKHFQNSIPDYNWIVGGDLNATLVMDEKRGVDILGILAS